MKISCLIRKSSPSIFKQLYDAFAGPLTIILKLMDQVLDGLIQVFGQLASVCQTILLLENSGERPFNLVPQPLDFQVWSTEGPLSGRYFDQIRNQFDFQVTGYQDDDALLV